MVKLREKRDFEELNLDDAEGLLWAAKEKLKAEKYLPSRELSLVKTKVDEALLWLEQVEVIYNS